MSDQPNSPESIFGQAIEIQSDDERAAFLEQACGHAPQLRADVEKLVADHFRAGSFLEEPVMDGNVAATMPPTSEQAGSHIGPYKLRERLGEGGMGVVWAAEQKQPLRRKVALKVIKPGMDSEQVLARFETEREALALMDHPNIARVIDAGTTDHGRPFFVMDLIRGVPITQYCDGHKLTIRERLALFSDVCSALQHAHQKGIIHRDVKPSNVLVTERDGSPVPIVIDFGVAKALHQPLTDLSVYSGVFQAIGTLPYMSPEQAALSATDVDTRVDIYGLGVLLYELLTGRTPFDRRQLESAAIDEACRIIREQDPLKPSTKISTLGEKALSISEGRRTNPATLSKAIRGDLDWIVMKSLEKDRTRRYETASHFSSDIRHFLQNEPVAARPPSSIYRFRKVISRHRGIAIALSIAAMALVVGFVGATTGFYNARLALDREENANEKLEAQYDKERALRKNAEDSEERAVNEAKLRKRMQYVADMKSARTTWDEGNISQTTRIVASYIPNGDDDDLRSFEWFHLQNLTRDARMSEVIHLPDVGKDIAYHPNPQQVALSMGFTPVTILWDIHASQRISTWGERKDAIWRKTFVEFSKDGNQLAHIGTDCRSTVIRDNDGDSLFVLQSPTDSLQCDAAFSDDGVNIVTADWDGWLRVWQGADQVNAVHVPGTVTVCVSPIDGFRFVFYGTRNGDLGVWDLSKDTTNYFFEDKSQIHAITISNDGQFLAVGTDEGCLVLNAQTGQELFAAQFGEELFAAQPYHRPGVWAVAFSPDGRFLASGGLSRTITLWDVRDGFKPHLVLKGHSGTIRGIDFSSDGRTLASISLDNTARLWRIARERMTDRDISLSIDVPDIAPNRCCISFCGPNQSVLAFMDGGKVRLFNPKTQEELSPLDTETTVLRFAASNGNYIVTAEENGDIVLWNLQVGSVGKQILCQNMTGVTALAFSQDDTILGIGTYVGDVSILRIGNGNGVRRLVGAHRGQVDALAFHPLTNNLTSAGWDGRVVSWDCQSESRVGERSMGGGAGNLGVAFSPDGDVMCVGSQYKGVFLCSSDGGGGVRQISTLPSSDVEFSQDGRSIFSASYGSVMILDVETGCPRYNIPHKGVVRYLDLSPNGEILATVDWKDAVHLFYAPR